jgi:urea transport system substrate-binding protein
MTPNPNGKTILVIDDETELLLTIKEYLESEGYQVFTAENGFAAMEVLKKGMIPNLILLDMKMPIMNGWEFALEFLNKHDHMSPIVVLTAAGDAEQRAKDINAIGWVEKPFNLNSLLNKIKLYERKSNKAAELPEAPSPSI